MINTIYSINAKPFLGEDEKYHYLYQITNIANGKIYVGIHSTTNLNDGYSGSGKVIIRAIEKSGEENFIKEIKCFYKNREELAKAENEIVNEEFIKDENTYNLVIGGGMRDRWSDESFCSYMTGMLKECWKDEEYRNSHVEVLRKNWTDETTRNNMIESIKRGLNTPESKEKRSNLLKEVWKREDLREKSRQNSKKQWEDPEYRKRYFETIKNEEYIEKQRQRTKEMWKDPEYRRKVSESNKKAYSDPELRKYMSEINKGKKRSEETRKRIGAASKGRICSPEKRKKLSESGKGKGAGDKNAMAKPLYQIDRAFNIVCEFGSRKSAMATVDFPLSQMIKSTKKFTLSPNGFYYIYKEDYQEFMYFINFENEVFE